MDTVLELEIDPGAAAGDFTVHVARSVAGGEPTEHFTLDVDALLATRPQLESVVLASSVSARRILPAAEVSVQSTGAKLFDAIFVGEVAATYRSSRAVAADRGSGLQVRLRLGAPGLAALPWEMLYDRDSQAYLCRQEPLVRQVTGEHALDALAVKPPLQVLAVVSSPRGLAPLDVAAEREHLEEALDQHVRSGRVRLEWVENATWAELHERLLQRPWHVLHFIGHGSFDDAADEGVIALVGADGRADFVTASSLADLLHEASPTPRLVVLNSCESGASSSDDPFSGTAAALARSGIQSVAAMQFTISDRAALAFARGFYTALANGRTIDEAMRSGRIGILGLGRGTLEWVTPVLYVRGQDTRLFDVADLSSDTVPEQDDTTGRRRRLVAAAAVLALLLGGVGAVVYRSMQGDGTTALGAVTGTSDAGQGSQDSSPSQGQSDAAPSPVEVSVPGNTRWLDSGVTCAPGTTLEISATGTIQHDASAGSTVGPDGLTDARFHKWNVEGLPDANTAGLIGSLDETEPFFVGSGTSYDCPRDGQLDLGINDTNLDGNSGALTVTVQSRPT
ncbi:CHAT domain-containing protein [Humibacillus xanthopallidus]|uniref:CHAT domain-containing protein n=1 Tax=Humibacillus xanthopallidus TaxID=412689 RepID=A0A543PWE2_9MICO|nr:CHAT domain-containing protein [Humibacillus xanthopallidus]TQN48399.1 CHAT domain-containing protein [Humibacillus xanthopallidus]